MARKVLLGANDRIVGQFWEKACRVCGYEVAYAQTPEEMITKVNYSEAQRYIMDVNFKSGVDIWPGRGAWNLVEALILEGDKDVKIITVSGDDRLVEKARKEGIPITRKTDFNLSEIMEFLRE
jgi:hypothetical protein